jgi:hypothetical protein
MAWTSLVALSYANIVRAGFLVALDGLSVIVVNLLKKITGRMS